MEILQNSVENIIIKNDNFIIEIIKDFAINKKIDIHNWSKLHYTMVVYNSTIELVFETGDEDCELILSFIFVGESEKSSNWKILCNINNSKSKANVHIISFLTDDSNIDVDWNITIWKNIKSVEWHLLEENIILWKNIKIKTKPILNVYSNDVKASHWARIDRLDTNKLFYMTSRWISETMTKNLIIHGYLNTVFEHFWEDTEVQKIKEEIVNKINK